VFTCVFLFYLVHSNFQPIACLFIQRDAKAEEGTPLKNLITIEPITGIKVLPHWLAQPYFRPTAFQKEAEGELS